jgi:hypothetical protein
MGNYFVRIQTTSQDSLRQLQQLADLDIFRHTARQLSAEAFEVEGLLSQAQIEQLRAAGYQVDVTADAEQVARERRTEIAPRVENQAPYPDSTREDPSCPSQMQ